MIFLICAHTLHLKRCFADIAVWVVSDLQRVHGQLTTHNDGGALDFHPSLVITRLMDQRVGIILGLDVIGGIKELDQLAIFIDSMRHPDFVAKALSDSLGQCGFSIAWLAVQKQSGAGVYRRPKALKE